MLLKQKVTNYSRDLAVILFLPWWSSPFFSRESSCLHHGFFLSKGLELAVSVKKVNWSWQEMRREERCFFIFETTVFDEDKQTLSWRSRSPANPLKLQGDLVWEEDKRNFRILQEQREEWVETTSSLYDVSAVVPFIPAFYAFPFKSLSHFSRLPRTSSLFEGVNGLLLLTRHVSLRRLLEAMNVWF